MDLRNCAINVGNIAGSFYENESQKGSQETFRIEKLIKRKSDNCLLNIKDMIINLIVGLIKRHSIK